MAQVHIHVVGVRAQCGCGLDGGAAQCAKNALPNSGASPDGLLYQTGFLVLAIAKMKLVFPMA
jgi:hypothetical protein